MDDTAPKYQYRPLEDPSSIRIIELLPARVRESTLRCNITHATRAEVDCGAVSYEALSYVWGDKPSRPIYCGGRYILVSPNCDAAMRHLRNTHTSRLLWIDAICIDQSADAADERSCQVRLMNHVYNLAQRVIVWLGDGPELANSNFEDTQAVVSKVSNTLKLIMSMVVIREMEARNMAMEKRLPASEHHLFQSLKSSETKGNDTKKEKEDALKHLVPKYTFQDIVLMFRFFQSNKWFCRIWTFQETAFAKEIIMIASNLELSWYDFKDWVALGIQYRSELLQHTQISLDWLRLCLARIHIRKGIAEARDGKKSSMMGGDMGPPSMLRYFETNCITHKEGLGQTLAGVGTLIAMAKPNLLKSLAGRLDDYESSTVQGPAKHGFSLLNRLCDHESTEPKDMVYAVQSLLAVQGLTLPEPDYRKTTRQVYEDTTITIIRQSMSLHIFVHSRMPDKSNYWLPSWVPDWHQGIGFSRPSDCTTRATEETYIRPWHYHGMSLFPSRSFNTEEFVSENCFATCHSKYHLPAKRRDGELLLSGYCLGTITDLIPLDENKGVESETTKDISEVFRLWKNGFGQLDNPPRELGNDNYERVEFMEWIRVLFQRDPRIASKNDLIHCGALPDFIRYTLRIDDQAIFGLSSGICGATDKYSQTGDVVVLAYGSDFPLVLRPYQRSYRFVGCVYVWKAMLGEMWPDRDLSVTQMKSQWRRRSDRKRYTQKTPSTSLFQDLMEAPNPVKAPLQEFLLI